MFYTDIWDATDACGNHSATVTQTITATDTHAPTIGAAGASATIDCTATPSFTAPTDPKSVVEGTSIFLGGRCIGNTCGRVYANTGEATYDWGTHSATRTL